MPTIGAPIQGYYYDGNTDTLRPYAGTPGASGASQYGLTLVGDATANVTLTSMAAAEDYFNGTPRYCTKVDLLNYTQCRLVVRKMATAGAAASKIMLKYSATNPANAFSGAAWTASGAEVALNTTNVTQDSGWVNMPAGMCVNDIFITATQSGGDGSAGPVTGGVWVYFRNPGIVIPQADFRGTIGYVESTTSGSAFTTTYTDVPSLTLSFTAVAGRRYKVTAAAVVNSTAAGDSIDLAICTASATPFVLARGIIPVANGYISLSTCRVTVPGAGPVTWKAQTVRVTGTGNCVVYADTNFRSFLLIEDIGT